MTPFEHQQRIKAQIIGSYNNANTLIKSEEQKPVSEPPASVNVDEAKKEEEKEKKEGEEPSGEDNEIQKSEGSRGGKVIGHTKSGKPIYEDHNHPTHKGFTSEDHYDAAHSHEVAYNKSPNEDEKSFHREAIKSHRKSGYDKS